MAMCKEEEVKSKEGMQRNRKRQREKENEKGMDLGKSGRQVFSAIKKRK